MTLMQELEDICAFSEETERVKSDALARVRDFAAKLDSEEVWKTLAIRMAACEGIKEKDMHMSYWEPLAKAAITSIKEMI